MDRILIAETLAPHHTAVYGPLGHALAVSGRTTEAREILKEMSTLSQAKYTSGWEEAMIYVGLGDHHRAIELLEENQKQRSIGAVMLRSDPRFDPLRAEPRFVALLKKANLVE